MSGIWELRVFKQKIDSSETMWLQHAQSKNQHVLPWITNMEEDRRRLELERTFLKIDFRSLIKTDMMEEFREGSLLIELLLGAIIAYRK